MINKLAREATPEELGGTLPQPVAEWTLIRRAESRPARSRSHRSRRTLRAHGEPIPPMLPATAEAQRGGRLGAGHVPVIRRFAISCRGSSISTPASMPKPNSPDWARSIGPTNSRGSPTDSPTASTPTAATPTTTAPAAAA